MKRYINNSSDTLIETERLFLRQFKISDATFLFDLMNSPKWIKFIGDRQLKTVGDASDYITHKFFDSYKSLGYGPYIILSKTTQAPIGMCSLVKRNWLEDVDIGFALLPQFEKQGFGYEATRATLDYATKDLAIKRIVGITQENNIASIKLLKKIGLNFEKMVASGEEELMLFGN